MYADLTVGTILLFLIFYFYFFIVNTGRGQLADICPYAILYVCMYMYSMYTMEVDMLH